MPPPTPHPSERRAPPTAPSFAEAPAERARPLVVGGNAAFTRFVSSVLARDPQPSRAPARAPTGDVVRDALTELRASSEAIDRNTAAAIDGGALRVRYLADVQTDPDSDALLAGWGYDKTKLVVKVCPDGERRVIPLNAEGTAHSHGSHSYLFVARGVSVARMRQLLVHETNHALRLEDGPRPAAESFERYKDEFQAYWVAEYRGVADLDARARQIRAHILRDYAPIAARYGTDTAFKALVDGHTRPDGNVLNSPNWRAAEEALAGTGTDETKLFAALNAMNAAEKALVRANADFMQRMRTKLSGDSLTRATTILGGP